LIILWERHPTAILWRLDSRSHEKDLSLENSSDNADCPAPIIPHVNADPASGIGKLIDQRLLDVKLDVVPLQLEVLATVNGPADPTDRPFDTMSSPNDGAARKDRHHPAAFGNELNLLLG
jgi:hypothetical protein